MEELVKNIFSDDRTTPPKAVSDELEKQFGQEVISVEWSHKDTWYEALFYCDQMEHIARFMESGNLLEYRVNLSHDRFPVFQSRIYTEKGEVMNMVEIHYPDRLLYEVIVRDRDLIRYELLVSQDGEIISEKVL